MERGTQAYRNGYYHGKMQMPRLVPETGIAQIGDDPMSGVLRPFDSHDYNQGYDAGRNDLYWNKRMELKW